MRNPLNKRYKKEFKNNFARYFCVFALLFITIIVGAGFMVVMDGTVYTLDKVEVECNQENGFFEVTDKVNEEALKQLEDRNLKVYENFYITDKEFDGNAKVFIFDERTEIDLPSVHEGRLPQKGSKNEIAVERLFANNRNISIGDKIDINGNQLEVVGLVSFIDYTALFFNNQDMMMNTTDFGVTVVSEECFENLDQSSITYRYSYRYEDQNKTDKEKLEEAKEIQKILVSNGNQVQNLLTAERNQSINYLKEDMGHDGPMIQIFIYILVGIIAFIFAVLTSNTIEQESAIIGTLRALGYKKGEIIWHYLVPTVVVAVAASGFGNLLGYTVMIEPFKTLYYESYCLPPLEIRFNMSAFIMTTLIPVALMIFINYVMLASKLKLSPLKFLRRDLKKKRQKKAVKLPNVKFLSRFRMRVLIQNKGSYLVLFFGIFLSSFLLMFGLGVGPLMDHYVDEIADTVNYNYMYMLKAPVEANGGEKAYMYGMVTNYYYTDQDIEVTFYGIDSEETNFFKDSMAKKGEVAISDSLAKKCKFNVGDEVTFTDNNTEKEYTLTVNAVNGYTNNLAVYMDIEDLRELLDADENAFNTYFSDTKLDIDDVYIAKYMTASDMIGAAKQMMITFDTIIKAFNVFSVFAYIVFLYILTKVVVDKNALYISFMKVFGYEKNEIRKLYLDASAIVVIVSLIICLPLEVWCFKWCTVYLSSLIEGYIEFYLPSYTYVELVVVGLVAYFSINAIHMMKVRKIPMNEALKNRE